jgi:hypothetical protein
MAERREELVGRTVEQAKELAADTRELASTQARLAAEEARDLLAPARPSLVEGALAAGLALGGVGLLLLPWLRRMSGHALLCSLSGGAAVGVAIALALESRADFPRDLRERMRELLRTDLGTAAHAATSP